MNYMRDFAAAWCGWFAICIVGAEAAGDGLSIIIVSDKEALVATQVLAVADVPKFILGLGSDLDQTIYVKVRDSKTPDATVKSLVLGLSRVGYKTVKLVREDARDQPKAAKKFDPDQVAALLAAKRETQTVQGIDDVLNAISRQLKLCARVPETGGSDLPSVHVKFRLNPDGELNGDVSLVNEQDNGVYLLAAEASVRAVRECAPFKLPPSHYELWKSVVWTFDWAAIAGIKNRPRGSLEHRRTYAGSAVARILSNVVVKSGIVYLNLTIAPNGELVDISVRQIDGPTGTDRVVLDAVERSKPFPTFSANEGIDPVVVSERIDLSETRDAGDVYARAITQLVNRNMQSTIAPAAGRARVLLLLDDQGNVARRAIETSSGNPQLDEIALKIVGSAAPFPKPFPEVAAAPSKNLKYFFTLVFRSESRLDIKK